MATGAGSIYRLTTTGQNEDSLGSTESIEFNGGAVPDTTAKNNVTGFRSTRDVSFHPNPRRTLTKMQDNLLGTKLVTITGWFDDHATTSGPANFDLWQREAAVNTDFPSGRFGLRLPDFASGLLTLVPTATKGYILVDVDVQDIERPRHIIAFTATLYRQGDAT